MNNTAGDGVFRYRDGIAVAQLVCFSAALLAAVHFRWTRRIGWFCIGVLALFRLIGAGCMLGTINKDTDGLWAGVFVCESLGVLLIIFLLLEMLERINNVVPVARRFVFIVPQVITWIDIGISIGGFVAVKQKEHGQLLPTPYSRAGIAILFVIYLWMAGTFVWFWLRRADYPAIERRTVNCVALCVPILAIRIVYSLIFIITADMTWNAVKGDSTAYLIMTMLPEVAIVALTSVTIMKIPSLTQEKGTEAYDDRGSRGSQNVPLV
ncbi:hypothetical protein ETB97_012287 [Aspergillus alliaceus]|uniref:DUF7702 domain-containing protein n=1 Tax=Petromyces alliaceus TaxID=209559 RepID=A0A5N7CDY5_PETAA|nr:uncharacterized protein BDW43DRAFT_115738 [Aspergillus alliaceus]KAB8238394.1 hypothetical protein BDW43DRAFT_115738 [Aspergillus alliaceus]KAE8392334.1 hypothetical protein BDV23DRAFT_57163 [Aspergillus alliaceus]KAF5861964.1 hypothetical protein ETB97_012287 [Aspergillus burnettii]